MNPNDKFSAALGIAFMTALTLAPTAFAQTQSSDIAFGLSTGNNQVYIGGQVVGAIPPSQTYLGGGGDSFLQAFTQEGQLLWTAEFGSTGLDWVNGVASDATGVYAAGFTFAQIAGQPYYGNADAYLAKYSLTGQQLWLHEFGSSTEDRLQAAVSDGTYIYTAGYTESSLYGQPFAGVEDCFVQKWDQSGNLLWTTEFGTSGTDRCYGIAVNSSGVYIAGRTDGAFPGQVNLGGLDAFVTMFDLSGNQVWLNQFGTPYDERGWGISAAPSGIYVTGRTEGVFGTTEYLGENDDDAYMAKFDYSGSMLWVNEFGTTAFDRGTSAAYDSTGVYGTGYTTGTLPGNVSAGYKDCYIRKWNNGAVIWTVQFGSNQDDVCWGVATDPTGVYVAGSAGGMLPGQTKPNGFFLEKFNTNGSSVWTREIEVPSGDSGPNN